MALCYYSGVHNLNPTRILPVLPGEICPYFFFVITRTIHLCSFLPIAIMTPPVDIQGMAISGQRIVSSWDQNNLSTSPTATFASPPGSWGGTLAQRGVLKQLKPFNTQDIKILLLENVNAAGQEILKGQGYQVEALKTSLPEDQLIEKIRYVRSPCEQLQDATSCRQLLTSHTAVCMSSAFDQKLNCPSVYCAKPKTC